MKYENICNCSLDESLKEKKTIKNRSFDKDYFDTFEI